MTKRFLLVFSFLACQFLSAQQSDIVLDEVIVSDRQLSEFSSTQSVQKISDSVIYRNDPSLRTLLNNNTLIYFKENSPGAVASPSFRGTTAQQTAVVWNGININSQFHGQTDFNVISTTDFSSITVKSGGGSVVYGSSAIGGSVHLDSELNFEKHFDNQIFLAYGSFDARQLNYNLSVSDKKFSAQFSISANASENDYDLPNGTKNRNGEFKNQSFAASFGYRINRQNVITYNGHFFDSKRHFSLLFPTDTPTRYEDFNMRNLLTWTNSASFYRSTLKLAHVLENYRFFENISLDGFNLGKAKNTVAKYDLLLKTDEKFTINPVLEYNRTDGEGSDITTATREIWSAALLLKHEISPKFLYEAGLRKESASNYDSPFLFSGGFVYSPVKFYSVRGNISRNFRIPTFNDLYWFQGGNAELSPETSLQGEVSNEFAFKDFSLSATAFYGKIDNMIQWLPGNSSQWNPSNVREVTMYGFEARAGLEKQIDQHKFAISGAYAYTISENALTGKQLIYVPFHKMIANAAYSFKNFTVDYRFVFNGSVFTRTDNNPIYTVDAYHVSDVGIEYDFKTKKQAYSLGVRLQNLFDVEYQVVENRYYPGQNFNIFLNIKL